MKIRKQVYELTLDDLKLSPIWEFAADEEGDEGQDEATVRPVALSTPLESVESMCVARADFFLADGTMMGGYLSPSVPGEMDLGHLQPTIVSNKGQVGFWWGIIEPSVKNLNTSYEVLGKRSQEIFPISFSLAVPTRHPVTGTISGFSFLSSTDFKSIQVIR